MYLHLLNFLQGRHATTLVAVLLLFVSFIPDTVFAQFPVTSDVLPLPIRAEVIGIQDGDTIELKYIFTGKKAGRRTGKPLRIRLLHVNCPERGAPYYKIAKQFTSQQCFGKTVQVKHDGKFDKYGRLLGEVVLPDRKVLNMELVKSGYAVHFKKYSTSTTYAELENRAKKAKLGIWGLAPQQIGKL
jgi:micrococcal nuclease